MIPVLLQLNNFLCYRNPDPVDFRGIQVACLTGENGAGKSSLLDAMTWALWGQARTRRDDDLIYQNEEDMQVQLDFLLGETIYRVIRKRSSRGRGRSVLDLQIEDGDGFRSVSEPAIRATQEKINRLIRLDYRTFINSAFLLQGRANEFTVQTPGERKAILATILGLDTWEVYEDRTKKRAHEIGQRAVTVAAQITEIDRELDRQDEYNDILVAAEERADQLAAELSVAVEGVRQIEACRQKIELKRGRQNDLAQRLDQAGRQMRRITADLTQQHNLVDEFNAILAAREDIESGYAALVKARKEESALGLKLSKHGPLMQQRASLEGAIAIAKGSLLAQQRALSAQCKELERDALIGTMPENLETVQAQLTELRQVEVDISAAREQIATLNTEAAGLNATNGNLGREMNTTKEKIDFLSGDIEADCPLCRQPLTEEHRQELVAQFETEGKELGDTYRENHQRIGEINGEREAATIGLFQLEDALSKAADLHRRQAKLESYIKAATAAAESLSSTQSQLDVITTHLDREAFALPEVQELSEVADAIANLHYDPDIHSVTRSTVAKFVPFETRKIALDVAAEKVTTAEAAIDALDSQSAEWAGSLAKDQDAHNSLTATISQLSQGLINAEARERELATLRESKVMADNEVGAARQRLTGLESQRERQEQLITEQSKLSHDAAIYQELRAAFGKRGVPAMIIEAVIPEIEETANRLLAKMTDGRMSLRFETQREKVTGGIAETLDIIISDELGARNYELYSGGESFRINFVIRIALSKLLAGRAGAQLRTLFIDEGFGTQDSRGRERLVEAINAIQSEFDRILVITHIDELKDAFPIRIEVTKSSAAGSQICIN